MTIKKLDEILKNHKLWLNNKGGEYADLSGIDLSGIDLRNSDLTGSNLSGINLLY